MGSADVSGLALTVDEMMKSALYIFDEQDWDTRIHTANAARDLGWDVTIGLLCEDAPNVETDFPLHPLPRPKQKLR